MEFSDGSGPVGRIGYGAMVLEGYYGAVGDDDAVAVLDHALARGQMVDSADAYGNGHNERLVARALAGRRGGPGGGRAFVATKFGIVFDDGETGRQVPTGWGFSLTINGTPAYMARALDRSLARLGTDCVDLYYLHYPDPGVDIAETVGAMAGAVAAGKVRYLGLSNVTAAQVRRAHAVHPIAAVQWEYSLWRREAEAELLPTLRELGIALVAWSPLGAGFLTGTVDALPEGDFRHANPRFAAANLAANRDRFAPLRRLAADLGVTAAQLALAWLLNQGESVYAIPGSRRAARVDENAAAADIALAPQVLAEMDRLMAPGTAVGATLI
ncbi:MAG: aldo/keto reductase [Hyphomicrobiales bacterium]|nr:aldo/keto reductase [Hyphomicrobiales bacterium]